MSKLSRLHIQWITDYITRRINITRVVQLRSLRTEAENPLTVKFKIIRTFPHIAEIGQTGMQFANLFPFVKINGAIEHGSAGKIGTLRSKRHKSNLSVSILWGRDNDRYTRTEVRL
ncbi:hypothetical protein D3C74_392290 [compost metagenome]